VQQDFEYFGYRTATPIFQDARVTQPRTVELGGPVLFQQFTYDGALPERCAMRKALPITTDGVFNALRMITKNVLAIDPATGQTADWIMGYLVVPVPTPIVVHAGDAPSVAFGYRPGDELHAFTGSLEATLPRVDLRDTTELATR
jgi:hypothetical protein